MTGSGKTAGAKGSAAGRWMRWITDERPSRDEALDGDWVFGNLRLKLWSDSVAMGSWSCETMLSRFWETVPFDWVREDDV